MLPYGIDYFIFEEYRAERLREAQGYRYTRETTEERKSSDRFSSLLIWLGRRLVVWGQYLEQRSVAQPASQVGSKC